MFDLLEKESLGLLCQFYKALQISVLIFATYSKKGKKLTHNQVVPGSSPGGTTLGIKELDESLAPFVFYLPNIIQIDFE